MGFHSATEHDVLFFLYFVMGLASVVGTTAYVVYRLIDRKIRVDSGDSGQTTPFRRAPH
jgi:hypothetical protein